MNMDMQSLIEEMNALILKIKSGAASQGEIEAFAAAAAELHERAVVLRYKSYEAKIFGTPIERIAEPVVETETPVAVVESEPVIESVAEPINITAEEVMEEVVAEELEEMSFDLFDESDSFDLFSTDVEEPKVETVAVVVEDESEDELEVETEAAFIELEEVTIEVEATLEVESSVEDETVVDEAEMEVEEEIVDEFTEETIEVTTTAPLVSGDVHPLYKRLVADDNSLAARLMAVRLETLKGAFGFNERLQIIQELFKGSGEDFTKAIETLDTLGTKNEARSIVSGYAHQFEWDKDSNLALEFIQKVERRYA